MSTHVSTARPGSWTRIDVPARRLAFVVLLGLVVLLPPLKSGGFEFPAVSGFWVCLPLAALFLLPLIDPRALRRAFHLDVVALLSFVVALGLERPGRVWPVLLIYPPLVYLATRMLAISRVFRSDTDAPKRRPLQPFLPRSWLVIGIVVLSAVHISWALNASAEPDVATGSLRGAQQLLQGRPLYDAPARHSQPDPHTDTYGPVNYIAYLPFASLGGAHAAEQLTTLFFDLLSALLLFALGRQVRGPTAGILLAYCWLAFPFTLYENALIFNDSIVAAGLLGTLLLARHPARRGAMAALVGWTKLSPLALVPLLAGCRPTRERSVLRGVLEFGLAFALATALVFVPALAHSSVSTFASRTFQFQAQRPAADSIWGALQGFYAAQAAWIGTASRIVHGLLSALIGAFALLLLRAPRRQDIVGLASASAAVLIAIQICLSYYSFSYVLWFAPLVMAALILDHLPGASDPPTWELSARLLPRVKRPGAAPTGS